MSTSSRSTPAEQRPPAEGQIDGHPRGTLVIVIVYGLLFALGWIAMYVYGFLARGAPHP